MKTTEEKIKELRDEFNLKLDGILAEGKAAGKFEVGKWYKGGEGTSVEYLTRFMGIHSEDANYTVGDYIGKNHRIFGYYENKCVPVNDINRPATTSEIEKALIAEAERKGFKEGVTVKSALSNSEYVLSEFGPCFNRDGTGDDLAIGGVSVYYKGKWAEILKDPPVTIAGEKVEYKGHYCTIARAEYHKKDLENLLVFLKSYSVHIKSINAGCSGDRKITASDIQNLLDKWPV